MKPCIQLVAVAVSGNRLYSDHVRDLSFVAPTAILPADWPTASWAGVVDPQDESRSYWGRRDSFCAICGEEGGGRGTSMWESVHKYGPRPHAYKHTSTP